MVDVADMDLMEKVDYVRSTITPLDLADMFEIDVVGDKIRSPWNDGERTPSCHLYEDGFFDYSTGRHGDVIDLYMQLSGKNWAAAVHRLAEGAQRMDVDPDRVQRVPKELPDLTEVFRNMRQPDYSSEVWATRLGPLSVDTLDWLWTNEMVGGSNEQMAIPHWHDGVVRGIKLRSANGQKSAVPGSTFACGLYRPHVDQRQNAIITEGESDAWALLGAHLPTACIYALPSGAGLWKDAWLKDLEQYETIYTAFDNDRAGKQATEKVRNAIGWGRWAELKVPDLYNDVREAMAAGWQPKL